MAIAEDQAYGRRTSGSVVISPNRAEDAAETIASRSVRNAKRARGTNFTDFIEDQPRQATFVAGRTMERRRDATAQAQELIRRGPSLTSMQRLAYNKGAGTDQAIRQAVGARIPQAVGLGEAELRRFMVARQELQKRAREMGIAPYTAPHRLQDNIPRDARQEVEAKLFGRPLTPAEQVELGFNATGVGLTPFIRAAGSIPEVLLANPALDPIARELGLPTPREAADIAVGGINRGARATARFLAEQQRFGLGGTGVQPTTSAQRQQAGTVAETAAGLSLPRNAGEAIPEFIPAIGLVPDAWRGLRALARARGWTMVDAAASAEGAQILARLSPEEDEVFARLLRQTVEGVDDRSLQAPQYGRVTPQEARAPEGRQMPLGAGQWGQPSAAPQQPAPEAIPSNLEGVRVFTASRPDPQYNAGSYYYRPDDATFVGVEGALRHRDIEDLTHQTAQQLLDRGWVRINLTPSTISMQANSRSELQEAAQMLLRNGDVDRNLDVAWDAGRESGGGSLIDVARGTAFPQQQPITAGPLRTVEGRRPSLGERLRSEAGRLGGERGMLGRGGEEQNPVTAEDIISGPRDTAQDELLARIQRATAVQLDDYLQDEAAVGAAIHPRLLDAIAGRLQELAAAGDQEADDILRGAFTRGRAVADLPGDQAGGQLTTRKLRRNLDGLVLMETRLTEEQRLQKELIESELQRRAANGDDEAMDAVRFRGERGSVGDDMRLLRQLLVKSDFGPPALLEDMGGRAVGRAVSRVSPEARREIAQRGAGAAVGAGAGATQGDTPEERLRNALIGAGAGTGVADILIRTGLADQVVRALRGEEGALGALDTSGLPTPRGRVPSGTQGAPTGRGTTTTPAEPSQAPPPALTPKTRAQTKIGIGGETGRPLLPPAQDDAKAWLSTLAPAQKGAKGWQGLPSEATALPGRAVKTVKDWVKTRDHVEQLVRAGIGGRFWYEDASRAILEVTGDKEAAKRYVGTLALLSNSSSVESNSALALRIMNQHAAGQPLTGAGSADQVKKLTAFLDNPDAAEAGIGAVKTHAFFAALMRNIDPEYWARITQGLPTVDVHVGRAYGYDIGTRIVGGKSVDKGITDLSYKLVSEDILRITKKLQQEDPSWTYDQVQAALWTGQKAQTQKKGLEEAATHYGDLLARHEASVPFETFPGSTYVGRDGTPQLDGIRDLDPDAQRAFHEEQAGVVLDAEGLNTIFRLLGLPQAGTTPAPGVFEGAVSPMSNVRAVVAPALGGLQSGRVDEAGATLLDAATVAHGMIYRQNAAAWSRTFPVKELYRQNAAEVNVGRVLTPEEAAALDQALPDYVAVVGTPSGADLLDLRRGAELPADKAAAQAQSREFQAAVQKALDDTLPADTKWSPKGYDSRYHENDWKAGAGGYEGALQRTGLPASKRQQLQDAVGRLREEARARAGAFAQRFGLAWDDEVGALGREAFSEEELTHLRNLIDNGDWTDKPGGRIGARAILNQLIRGETPSPKQLDVLERVLGSNVPEGVAEAAPVSEAALPAAAGKGPPRSRQADVFGVPRLQGESEQAYLARIAGKPAPPQQGLRERIMGALRRLRGEEGTLGREADATDAIPGEIAPTPGEPSRQMQLTEAFDLGSPVRLADGQRYAKLGDIVDNPGALENFTKMVLGSPKYALTHKKDLATLAIQLPRTLKTAIDIGWGGRNGWRLFPRNPRAWMRAYGRQYTTLAKEEAYQALQAQTAALPNFNRLHDAGLAFLERASTTGGDIQRTAETGLAPQVSSIPILRQTERAYIAPGNAMRYEIANDELLKWEKRHGFPMPDDQVEKLVQHLNSATLRGDTRFLSPFHAEALGSVLFSTKGFVSGPQYVYGGLKALVDPNLDMQLKVRIAGDVAAYISGGLGVLGMLAVLGKQTGSDDFIDVDFNKNSPTFGQVSIGGQRWNYWGTDQSLVRQILTQTPFVGGKKVIKDKELGNVTVDTQRLQEGVRYLSNKLAPGVPRTAFDLGATAIDPNYRTFSGRELDTPEGFAMNALEQVVPIPGETVTEAYKNKGPLIAVSALLADLNGFTQSTYELSLSERDRKAAIKKRAEERRDAIGANPYQDVITEEEWVGPIRAATGIDPTGTKDVSELKTMYVDSKTQAYIEAERKDGREITEAQARKELGAYFEQLPVIAGTVAERDSKGGVRKRNDDGLKDELERRRIEAYKAHPEVLWEQYQSGVLDASDLSEVEWEILLDAGYKP